MGKSYSVGIDKHNAIKLDVFYTDPFIRPARIENFIRLAEVEEIIAMKIDVVQRDGRRKDFWDIHELLEKYNIREMLDLHRERYEFSHDKDEIMKRFTDFGIADNEFDPLCLRGKYWEFIKEDIEDAVDRFLQSK